MNQASGSGLIIMMPGAGFELCVGGESFPVLPFPSNTVWRQQYYETHQPGDRRFSQPPGCCVKTHGSRETSGVKLSAEKLGDAH